MLLRTKNERMLSQEGGKWGGEMLEDYFPLVKYPISPTRIAFPKVFRPNWGKFSGFPRFRAKSLPTHSNSKQLSADLSITVYKSAHQNSAKLCKTIKLPLEQC